MINIAPITSTDIHWGEFNERICNFLDRSPYTDIREPVSDYRTFLLALSNLHNPENKRVLLETLDHLFFGFIVHGDSGTLLDLVSRTKLRILIMKSDGHIKTAIVSGSLQEFRIAIQQHLQYPESEVDYRVLFGWLVLYFEHLGLGSLWREWIKKPMPDGTFLLEHKS